MTAIEELLAASELRPIEEAEKRHQVYILGYSLDIWFVNAHWRDDKNSWCLSWDQSPCELTHFMPIPPTDNTLVEKAREELAELRAEIELCRQFFITGIEAMDKVKKEADNAQR